MRHAKNSSEDDETTPSKTEARFLLLAGQLKSFITQAQDLVDEIEGGENGTFPATPRNGDGSKS